MYIGAQFDLLHELGSYVIIFYSCEFTYYTDTDRWSPQTACSVMCKVLVLYYTYCSFQCVGWWTVSLCLSVGTVYVSLILFVLQDSSEVEDCMTPSEVRPTQAEDIKRNSSESIRLSVSSTSSSQIAEWEEQQLDEQVDFKNCKIDPAPFQLVEQTSLHKVQYQQKALNTNRKDGKVKETYSETVGSFFPTTSAHHTIYEM